jgi:hypothetical protein
MRGARAALRRLGLGRLLYHAWHRPLGWIGSVLRDSPMVRYRAARGRAAMREAAHGLPAPRYAEGPPLAVHFLTGIRFIEQTAFCLWSLAMVAEEPWHFALVDDGSLESSAEWPRWRATLDRIAPARWSLVTHAEAHAAVAHMLPPAKFPVIHERRAAYPNIRKLLDVHAAAPGRRLVLDSDMLFFARPAEIVEWLRGSGPMLLMRDVETSYGHAVAVLSELAGAPVEERLNVGVTGLETGAIDWPQLEAWWAALIARDGTSYFDEQALIAMLAARLRDCRVLPERPYLCLPRGEEIERPSAILQHYVADAKWPYFTRSWRVARERLRSA